MTKIAAARSITVTDRQIAEKGGYYIRAGNYQGTPDDRLGRWYVGHENDEFFRPHGAGHRTQKAAWAAARQQAEEDGVLAALYRSEG